LLKNEIICRTPADAEHFFENDFGKFKFFFIDEGIRENSRLRIRKVFVEVLITVIILIIPIKNQCSKS